MSTDNALEAVAADFVRLSTQVYGPWDLPITFSEEGGVLKGSLSLELGADLANISIDEAQKYIRLGIQQALLSRIAPPSSQVA